MVSFTTASSALNVTDLTPPDYSDCSVNLSLNTRRIWLFLLSLLIYVMGLILNVLVVLVNWRRRASPNGVVFCTLNMAISDLISMLVLPFFMLEFTLDHVWLWGHVMCGLLHFIDLTTFYSTSFFLAYLSVERYLALKRTGPRPWGPAEQRNRAMVCGALWLFSAIPAVAQSAHTRLFEFVQPRCYFYTEHYFIWYAWPIMVVLCQFLVPSVIIITFNLLTMRVVRAFPEVQRQGGWSQPWLLHLYSAAFFLCWMPKHLFMLLFMSHFELRLFSCKAMGTLFFFDSIINELSSVHCVTNPILYNFLCRGFRSNLAADVARLLSRWEVTGVVKEESRGQSNVESGEERDEGSNSKHVGEVMNDSSTSQSDVSA